MDQPRMITYKTKDGQIGKVTRDTELPEGAVGYIDPEQYYPSHVATDFLPSLSGRYCVVCRDGL